MNLFARHLDQSHNVSAGLAVHLDHGLEQVAVFFDNVVTEQNRERLIAGERRGSVHGVAQTLGSALANIVDVAKFGRRLHQVELLLVAFGLKARLEIGRGVEVVL
ncbi:unannotated protein [freshwater metagenome]|uniref:Unannotated protein n=1 Tax=freshwater metagenome TaxID=449393 RepID=A0A6J6BVM4_9ZZZZ